MIVRNYLDSPPTEDAPGVLRRVVIGPDEGAPRFIMRVFHVAPGCSTPFHSHWWEHEVFVLEGDGAVECGEDERQIEEGMVVFIAPNEEHCFTNTGNEVLRFICVIPVSE
ncbi:MAG: cupin domain-containing protein [Chloroflexi bacterium]|nr:cupin domain-containing protein [Chloroflexota bacterium]